MIDIEQLRERLSDIGFDAAESERGILEECIKRSEQTIMNYCNLESVPDQLQYTALDMAAGEYLMSLKCSGEETRDVHSVSEGDISVTFEGTDKTEKLIDELLSGCREDMASFRRIKW